MKLRKVAKAISAVVLGSMALGAAIALALTMLSEEPSMKESKRQGAYAEVVAFKAGNGVEVRVGSDQDSVVFDENGPFLSIMQRLTESVAIRDAGASVACAEQQKSLLGRTYDLLFGEPLSQPSSGSFSSRVECDRRISGETMPGIDSLRVKTSSGVVADLGAVPRVVPSPSLD